MAGAPETHAGEPFPVGRTKSDQERNAALLSGYDYAKYPTNTAEVHVFLTKLADGHVLATYSNYHLPYASCAIVSADGGRTWDRDSIVRLSVSADLYVGWAVTLQLPDDSLMTSYAITSYLKEPPDSTTCEVVRWRLPN